MGLPTYSLFHCVQSANMQIFASLLFTNEALNLSLGLSDIAFIYWSFDVICQCSAATSLSSWTMRIRYCRPCSSCFGIGRYLLKVTVSEVKWCMISHIEYLPTLIFSVHRESMNV